MRRHFVFLERMKLFQLFQSEREDVVIQRAGGAAQQFLEVFFVARLIPFVQQNGATNMPSRFSFETNLTVLNIQFEPAAMSAAVERLVAADASTPIETKEHCTNEGHERTFAGFIRPKEDVQAGGQRFPIAIGPNAESVDMNVIDLHAS